MSLEFSTCSILKTPLKYSNSETKRELSYLEGGSVGLSSDISSSESLEDAAIVVIYFLISGFSFGCAEFQSALILSCIMRSYSSISKVSISSLVKVADRWPGLSLLHTLSSQVLLLGSISYSTKQLIFEIGMHLIPVNALPPNFSFILCANETDL